MRHRSVVVTIIIINVAIFVLDMFSPEVRVTLPTGQTVATGQRWVSDFLALKTDVVQKPWNGWQLLTCGFAHASISSKTGIMHLAFNMLTLFFLGRPVELLLGAREFLKFYLVAIVFSSLIWLLAHVLRGQPGSAVGASGAVTAVVLLFVFHFPRQTLLLMGIIPIPAWLLGLMLVGLDILNSFNSESQIAVEAHLAGATFAAAYYFFHWNFQWLQFGWLTERLQGRPKLKVHDPDRRTAALNERADQILQKVHREGEGSLTRRERRILEQYSRQVRDQRKP